MHWIDLPPQRKSISPVFSFMVTRRMNSPDTEPKEHLFKIRILSGNFEAREIMSALHLWTKEKLDKWQWLSRLRIIEVDSTCLS